MCRCLLPAPPTIAIPPPSQLLLATALPPPTAVRGRRPRCSSPSASGPPPNSCPSSCGAWRWSCSCSELQPLIYKRRLPLLNAVPDNITTGSSSRRSPRESFGDGADDHVGGGAAAAGCNSRRLHRLQECRLLLLHHPERSTCDAACNVPKRRLHRALTAAVNITRARNGFPANCCRTCWGEGSALSRVQAAVCCWSCH
jgi:hypothetical protein